MRWITLTDIGQLDGIANTSGERPVLIFKHSTTCSISRTALDRSECAWAGGDHLTYLLDLLRHRDVSNAIAAHYGIEHESPQVLVIRNGACMYHSSHFGITYTDVLDAMMEIS